MNRKAEMSRLEALAAVAGLCCYSLRMLCKAIIPTPGFIYLFIYLLKFIAQSTAQGHLRVKNVVGTK